MTNQAAAADEGRFEMISTATAGNSSLATVGPGLEAAAYEAELVDPTTTEVEVECNVDKYPNSVLVLGGTGTTDAR